MSIFKCKMCGGSLEISDNQTVAICEYCGSKQTVPTIADENIRALFNRANILRMKSEFDKAAELYEKILQTSPTEAEAYWGLILCKYGVEYVEDPKTFKRIPTCHRTSYEAITADEDYKNTLYYSDASQRLVYESAAKEIDEIQKGILAISLKEDPYDVFICYKETDENGKRTQDSVIANDIYYQLTHEGFKVFYSAITLEDKLGSEYEPYIFSALNSAKVMLVLGTKPEHFNAVWVKNEWSRFLKIMTKDRSKLLIPCYRDMDPYELPEEFAHLQAQDMSKIGFINDVVRGISKVIVKKTPDIDKTKTTIVTERSDIAPLLKRAFMYLEDGEWQNANDYCERVLDMDPENAEAYLGKLMAELECRNKESLKNNAEPFDDKNSYQRAVRFADEELKSFLASSVESIKERNENTRLTNIYNKALKQMETAATEDSYKAIAETFESIRFFKDSESKAKECLEKAVTARKNLIYANAKKQQTTGTMSSLEEAIENYSSILGWKDADEQVVACQKQIEDEECLRIERERKVEERARIVIPIVIVCIAFIFVLNTYITPKINYNKAMALIDSGDYESAYVLLKDLNYKDSEEKINSIFPKYKEILFAKAEVGSTIYLGNYEQDNDLAKGKEGIEWLVIDKQDDKALVISKYALDCKPYNTPLDDVTWETCTLRKWLNNTFINDAFSAEEQEMILTSYVSADKNPDYDKNPGNATEDKIFLLSVVEADKYFDSAEDRICVATDYAIAQGAYTDTNYKVDEKPTCYWWLRSPGRYQCHAVDINSYGYIYKGGDYVNNSEYAVRPALWINLES